MAKAATKKPRTKRAGPSKSQKARDYKAANPTATTQEIAKATGLSYNAVYQALAGSKKSSKKKSKKGRMKSKTTRSGHEGLLGAAENFIKEAGSAMHAREFLDRLSRMFAK